MQITHKLNRTNFSPTRSHLVRSTGIGIIHNHTITHGELARWANSSRHWETGCSNYAFGPLHRHRWSTTSFMRCITHLRTHFAHTAHLQPTTRIHATQYSLSKHGFNARLRTTFRKCPSPSPPPSASRPQQTPITRVPVTLVT